MQDLQIISLNCQKGYWLNELRPFLENLLREAFYDFVLLQEASTSVIQILESSSTYSLLQAFNAEVNMQSQICILYRNSFQLQHSSFYPFVRLRKRNAHRPEFGVLIGIFRMPDQDILISSLHINPGLQVKVRKAELLLIKDYLTRENPGKLPVIFGGDFNSAFWWEDQRNKNIFASEFRNCTSGSGPTHDSKYVEPIVLINRIGLWLAQIGINLHFKTDHIYLDEKTADAGSTACKVLPDRVSDHSPLALTLALPES